MLQAMEHARTCACDSESREITGDSLASQTPFPLTIARASKCMCKDSEGKRSLASETKLTISEQSR